MVCILRMQRIFTLGIHCYMRDNVVTITFVYGLSDWIDRRLDVLNISGKASSLLFQVDC